MLSARGPSGDNISMVRDAIGRASMLHRLFTDATCRGNPGPSGAGAVLLSPGGAVLATSTMRLGILTCNAAEYTACFHALQLAHVHNVRRVIVLSDSLLLVRQMRGVWRVTHRGLQPLHEKVKHIAGSFDLCRFAHVPRVSNTHADRLANEALDASSSESEVAFASSTSP